MECVSSPCLTLWVHFVLLNHLQNLDFWEVSQYFMACSHLEGYAGAMIPIVACMLGVDGNDIVRLLGASTTVSPTLDGCQLHVADAKFAHAGCRS